MPPATCTQGRCLVRRQSSHAERFENLLRSGRDAAATRRPADATGCISKSAPVGDREAGDPGLRNRVEARAEPHPPAPRSPPRAAPSLARERFAEKQASGSRPRRVVRRSCLRPDPSVRGRGSPRSLLSSRRRGPGDRNGDDPALRRRRRQLALCHGGDRQLTRNGDESLREAVRLSRRPLFPSLSHRPCVRAYRTRLRRSQRSRARNGRKTSPHQ